MDEKQVSSMFSEIPESIQEMDREMEEERKKIEAENLKIIKERNEKARLLIKKFSEPIIIELDDIEFKLKSITVALWDEIQGNKDDEVSRSKVVKGSLVTPELSDEEFDKLPAGIKYKLFMFLLQDFFLIAGRMKIKNSS